MTIEKARDIQLICNNIDDAEKMIDYLEIVQCRLDAQDTGTMVDDFLKIMIKPQTTLPLNNLTEENRDKIIRNAINNAFADSVTYLKAFVIEQRRHLRKLK